MADLLGSRRRRVRSGIWALSGRVRMIGRPPSLTPRPGLGASSSASGWTGRPAERMLMSADALSDVLRTVRLTGATFFDVVATAPWVAEQPPREKILPKILPGAGHLIAYPEVDGSNLPIKSNY